MQAQMEILFDERFNAAEQIFQIFLIFRKNDKVISITNVVLYPQFLLHIYVKLMHVYVHQKLRGQIS